MNLPGELPKVSIITVMFNSAVTVKDCIDSVAMQDYPFVEHILVDGGSKDGTIDIIRANETRIARWISEPDQGIYDALNKGILMSSGEIVGILNADDFYPDPDVISTIVQAMRDRVMDSCYGDIDYVDSKHVEKTVRAWRSGPFEKGMFFKGRFPAHPTFFVKRAIYDRLGLYTIGLRLAADFELMLRFLERHAISTCYIPRVLVKMRTRGSSNRALSGMVRSLAECREAFRLNGFKAPMLFVPKTLLFRMLHIRGRKKTGGSS